MLWGHNGIASHTGKVGKMLHLQQHIMWIHQKTHKNFHMLKQGLDQWGTRGVWKKSNLLGI